ncbi:permease [Aquabacterium sp.]|uniref:permease n=1 Tax=Aquabacterium sp. TaxID=1872578 RepID=UPI0040378F6E
MNDLGTVVNFVLVEGALLAALFFGVSMMVALLQQGVGQRLNAALHRTSLGTGSMVAATAGAVTPFCSCSTVPVLAGMLQARIRFGVCFTFLIASPVINEGVLLVLMREYSWAQTSVFLLVAFGLSVAFGVLVDRMGMVAYVRSSAVAPVPASDALKVDGGTAEVSFKTRLRFAAQASLTELRAAFPYLFVGLLVGGLIYGYVPDSAIAELGKSVPSLWLIFLMALIGVPFYVNAAMVVPIAVALIAKGISIGPVAAFLVSAAGTSIPEVILLARLFKAPLVLAHVVVIVASATLIGLALEWATYFN